MSTFKITNITNLLGKREAKYNSVLDIDYVDDMLKKKITIKAGGIIYLSAPSLPISAHLLRVKNLITVVEVSDNEAATANVKPVVTPKVQPVVKTKPVVHVEEPPKSTKKNIVKEEVTD